MSLRVWRGERPDAAKLAALAGGDRVGATINLCAEMPEGDVPAIAAAGLAGQLRTTHIPITDMESPTVDQLTEIMDLLSGPDGDLTYVHCEAGRGRTGVAIACYRMAVSGWGVEDALTEAVNFGCIVPGPAGVHPRVRPVAAGRVAGGPVPAAAGRLGERDAGPAVDYRSAPQRSPRNQTSTQSN